MDKKTISIEVNKIGQMRHQGYKPVQQSQMKATLWWDPDQHKTWSSVSGNTKTGLLSINIPRQTAITAAVLAFPGQIPTDEIRLKVGSKAALFSDSINSKFFTYSAHVLNTCEQGWYSGKDDTFWTSDSYFWKAHGSHKFFQVGLDKQVMNYKPPNVFKIRELKKFLDSDDINKQRQAISVVEEFLDLMCNSLNFDGWFDMHNNDFV